MTLRLCLKLTDGLDDLTPERLAEQILKSHDADGDDMITQEEYLVWTVSHALPAIFLDLLFQVRTAFLLDSSNAFTLSGLSHGSGLETSDQRRGAACDHVGTSTFLSMLS